MVRKIFDLVSIKSFDICVETFLINMQIKFVEVEIYNYENDKVITYFI